MTRYKKILSILLLAALVQGFTGCKKFDDLNTNPDAAVKVTSGMLATGLILDIAKPSYPFPKWYLRNHFVSKYLCWSEGVDGYQYNKFDRSDFDGLRMLTNVDKMANFATSDDLRSSYQGLGHFIRAYKFFHQTMTLGDVPYSDAIKAQSGGIYNPKYDSQRDVFIGILNELDQADALFAKGAKFDGDPIYGGNTTQWRKAVNTFALKVLISLHKKAADADLKVAARMQAILSGRPIFASNADNFQIVYSDKAGQKFPFYKEANNYTVYPMVSSVVVDSLKKFGDRRLFYYANPSKVAITAGASPSDWAAYKGTDPSMVFTELSKIATSKDFSPLNSRYTEIPQGEPSYLFSFAEMNFTLAEAVVRNLISGNAKDYYEKGIIASMSWVAKYTPDLPAYNHGMPLTDAYIAQYVTSAPVAFSTDPSNQIRQIIVQKYLTTYIQSPWSAYYEYRRTGYPKLPVNPLSNLNIPNDRIPTRLLYPQAEYDYNSDNLKAAIGRQYSGQDDVNGLMWVLKD